MRKSRFSETQIVSILKEHDVGASFVDLGRRHGVHPNIENDAMKQLIEKNSWGPHPEKPR